ncbi:acyl-CoA dehydrogenase family protein [Microbacterium sp. CPCC 204701]|uniref:acyl-CoA dehydrogenase family protein n=1 Tax=Microbacterium sp. CPCC 204701 TaxID=2493084 RepID=UPI000FD95CA5|nr:acyl-CoA dehydrogenase family protein [Microbacterium sp. CPCC 204701]
MIFDLSEEQREFRDAVAGLCARSAPPARALAHAGGDDDLADAIWAELAELGVMGAAVPEEFDGLGLPAEVLAPILELAGRHALAIPLLETLAVALPLLTLTSDEELRRTWLPALAAGELRAAVQYAPGDPVAFGATADLLLLRERGCWSLVPAAAVEADALASIDPARPLAKVRVADVARVPIPLSDDARDAVESSIEVGVASALVGVSARILEMTVEHVAQRQQFGRPIGSFQAVKHKLADIWMAVESARSASWYAAHRACVPDGDGELPSAVARVAAVQAADLAGQDGLQLHGAIGFTWEYPLHLWLKLARSLAVEFGGPAASIQRLRAVAVPAV